MTKAQEWILKYLDTQFERGSIHTFLLNPGTVRVTDRNGEVMRFTVNGFGDIMDADTKEIIAECDVPHNLDVLARNIYQEPKSWTNLPGWFEKRQRSGLA